MSSQFERNPDFARYESLLLRLNELMAQGDDEGYEGEKIREEMEYLFWRLSEPERVRLGGLSADLYMLQDDEVYEPLDPGQTQSTLEKDLKEAWRQQDMEALLRLLRTGPSYLSKEGLASLRAQAYQVLGHLDSALAFKEYAAQLNPQEIAHKLGILHLLYALNHREAATAQARSIIADPKASSDMIAAAGYVLSKTASSIPEEQGERAFATAQRRIASNLESLLTAA